MKIEKLNDNQIRCTLTRADLAARHLKLSELAYGTEKAKSLFRDMMQQASFDFGFEAEDIPLMIEAIPASADSIVLIITKVEDPEELDTRFSKFTPFGESDANVPEALEKLEGAEEFLNLLNKVKEAAADTKGTPTVQDAPAPFNVRLFSFESMDRVIQVAHLLGPVYHGSNTLYHDTENELYILALTQSDHSNNEFNKICNMLSEYGSLEKASGATLAFLEEHCDITVSANAVQKLADV
ncbi:adaptor protein MecA [Faecalicatena sp. AGMB00832]|uniref:Adaptor protein MecA n=1 Tax=Faecalicatena faecalis TaxID=2726362 RepID=A0ABS6D4L2_9FIRM|nr:MULTISPECIES: adaptor protein MecA [Faecalicatena]MBU3876532.1 adaptor protein MecA [Faecalicatena faecalis]MCI6467374.1 adaptor protein MecA [Faecalicatena sp.]MDY5621030.1 adaptor protein MecA [Lachnospiraceae bacterium]